MKIHLHPSGVTLSYGNLRELRKICAADFLMLNGFNRVLMFHLRQCAPIMAVMLTNIAESYQRHCWVQVMMNVENRIKEYLVYELSKVPAFRILKRARVVKLWIEAIDNKVRRILLTLNDMAQLVNIGDRHRVPQGFCASVNRIYSDVYPIIYLGRQF
ncbi:hypothetical protein MIR68_000509 [Amoeboaphelidium protococcarum]|nr:hypothetical protein MIR68_000509 [Amoeboaphelidium protococcarum]